MTVAAGSFTNLVAALAIVAASPSGVIPAAGTSLSIGREILPSGLTTASPDISLSLQNVTIRTSSTPITYSFGTLIGAVGAGTLLCGAGTLLCGAGFCVWEKTGDDNAAITPAIFRMLERAIKVRMGITGDMVGMDFEGTELRPFSYICNRSIT